MRMIKCEMVTGPDYMYEACAATVRKGGRPSLACMFECEHSPIREIEFVFEMELPTFVSVHFVRHSCVGQRHYVQTNREDRGGDSEAGRTTPVVHRMRLNAQHLIDMAKVRLCGNASAETRDAMMLIRGAVRERLPELANAMNATCVYRGFCPELKCCGRWLG